MVPVIFSSFLRAKLICPCIDDLVGFDAADLDRDLIAERLKKDDVGYRLKLAIV